jgi:hypothetical protein
VNEEVIMQRQTVETLAKASWALPLVAFALNAAASGQGHDVAIPMAFVGFGIYVLAFICGVFSLFMVKRFGTERILVNAIVGTGLSGLLVAVIGAVLFIGVMVRMN